MGSLDDRVVMVTGAGRGMGRCHALRFSEQGPRVIAQDIDGELVEQTSAIVREAGGAPHPTICDIADIAAVADGIRHAECNLGGIGRRTRA
jgi:NAD(P)-dependent dehydrogenase (short-subunit alcohol dehydrogenase family)